MTRNDHWQKLGLSAPQVTINDIVHNNLQVGLIWIITITINTNLQAGRQVPSDGEAGGKRRRSGERCLALRTGIEKVLCVLWHIYHFFVIFKWCLLCRPCVGCTAMTSTTRAPRSCCRADFSSRWRRPAGAAPSPPPSPPTTPLPTTPGTPPCTTNHPWTHTFTKRNFQLQKR